MKDRSDLINGEALARILGVSYRTVWRMTKTDERLRACAVTSGFVRPRYRYSRALLRKAGVIACLAVSAVASASDIMHVPLLCKYHQESHFVAGGIVGAIVNYTADSYDMRFVPRLVASTVVALAAGTFKEYLIDKTPRPSEIWPWGAGAVVVSLAWSFKW